MFNAADNDAKQDHSDALSAMIYIAHVLPFACKSEDVRELTVTPPFKWRYRNFHQKWPLNGWNDDIIKPARDTVVAYWKVCPYSIAAPSSSNGDLSLATCK